MSSQTAAHQSPGSVAPQSGLASFRFYWIVTTAGAVLMALEIVSSRVLSPHFGSSVYVWGSIISVFLASLSLGYAIGGPVADRFPSIGAMGRLVLAIALGLGLIQLTSEPLAAAFGRLTGGSPSGTLLAASVLFGPTSILLGMVAPYAIRLAARDLAHLGNTAGRLYALSTAGSLLGTLASTFVLIPFLQLRQIFALLLAITAASGLWAVASEGRRRMPELALGSALLVLAATGLPAVTEFEGALYRRISPYQTLQVVELDNVLYLQSEGVNQAAIDRATGLPALKYFHVTPAPFLVQPEIQRILVLGMGGANAGLVFRAVRPEVEIHYVEIDPAVVEIAEEYFDLETHSKQVVHVQDARRYLERSDAEWDLIFCDTYIGMSVPFHLATEEFFDLARTKLAPGGVLAANLAGGLDFPFTRAIYRTLSEAFPVNYVFQAPFSENVIVVATRESRMQSDDELAARAATLEAPGPLPMSLVQIAGQRRGVDLDLLSVPLLTDRFAPVERLAAERADTEVAADVAGGR